MNIINFSPLDYGNMMRRYNSDWDNTLSGMNAMGESIKEANDRQRKWDSVIALERQGQEAVEAQRKYNESLERQRELQGYIDTNNEANRRNGMLIDEWNRLYDKGMNNGVVDARGRKGFYDPTGNNYTVVNDDGSSETYGIEGIRNGLWEKDGLIYSNVGRTDDEQRRMDEINGLIGNSSPVDNSGLEWKLARERQNGLNYKKAGQNAAMYQDPRYLAALETAKANNDPSAIYNYMNQWKSEEPGRMRMETMSRMRNGYNFDAGRYGDMASYLYNIMRNTDSPEEFYSAMTMLNGIVAQRDQYDLSMREREDEQKREDRYAEAMHDFNSRDWTDARFAREIKNLDIDYIKNNPRQRALFRRTYLGTPDKGPWNDNDEERLQEIFASESDLKREEDRLKGLMGSSMFYRMLDDAEYKRLRDIVIGQNRSKSFVSKPRSKWES